MIGDDSKAAISSMTGDAKVTGALTSKRIWAAGLVAVPPSAAGACKRDKNAGPCRPRRWTVLADALRPDAFAAAMKRIGGAHFHATARFAAGRRAAHPTWSRRRPTCGSTATAITDFASRTIATVAARWCCTGASSPLRYAMGR
jgi:hypothetical protein